MPSKSAKPKRKGLYSVHPAVAMVQKWVAELPGKTGRTLEAWVALIRKDGPDDEKARRAWLKEYHGFGTNQAWWLAGRAGQSGKMGIAEEDPDVYLQQAERYVAEMFSGGKAGLRPIYDELLTLGLGLADDVKACPCKTIVPLYRNHVFAELKPSTRTRLDLGLALGKAKGKLPARLIGTGGKEKKDRITHRIAVHSVDEIDDQFKQWLQTAYDLDA
jgi:hypothetical protein